MRMHRPRHTEAHTGKHTPKTDRHTHTSTYPCPREHRTLTFAYSFMPRQKWTRGHPHFHAWAPLHIPSAPCAPNLGGPRGKCHEQSVTLSSPNHTHGEQAETWNLMASVNIPSFFWGTKVGVQAWLLPALVMRVKSLPALASVQCMWWEQRAMVSCQPLRLGRMPG